MLVFTMSFKHRLQVLRELLTRLREAMLTAQPGKCHFCFETIECLGHVVGGHRSEPNPDKLKAIQDDIRPQTRGISTN